MMVPFRTLFDRFFNDPTYRWVKVPVAAVVLGGLCLAATARMAVRNPAKPGWSADKLPIVLGVTLAGAVFGVALGTVLVLKDITA